VKRERSIEALEFIETQKAGLLWSAGLFIELKSECRSAVPDIGPERQIFISSVQLLVRF
jgi:hypothetical protein